MLSMCAIAFTLSQGSVGVDTQYEVDTRAMETAAMVDVLTGYSAGSLLMDLNGDGLVDFFDIVMFINCFNTGAACADINGDGVIDFFDIQLFIAL